MNQSNNFSLKDASVLVTGGTGSFGKAFIRKLMDDGEVRRCVVFSRDELKQFEMQKEFPASEYPGLRFFLGDVRDLGRLRRAFEGVDVVIHAAALKQVVAAEYNPFEFVQTNVLGAQNIVEACLDTNVKRLVALSTDKAAAPINLYGATKLCSDKLIVAANNVAGDRDFRLSIVRYGNVMGSRGSVIPFFLKQKSTGTLPITDPAMTRFNISLSEGVDMVFWALKNMEGGEIFVPKIPSYRVTDVAEAICEDCEKPVIGVRPGEKIHEQMITTSDSENTVDIGDYYAILPNFIDRDAYLRPRHGHSVPSGFSYDSETNEHFLTVAELRQLIDANIPE